MDPLFNLEDIQVKKPLEVYTKTGEPGIHYITPFEENEELERRSEEAWVQSLNEDAQIWGMGGWGVK